MDDIVKEAREAIQVSYDADRDNRREAMEDLRFVAGFQWSEAERQEREGRPIITINRSTQFLRQVSNPIRQNMPTIKVEPDSDEDKELASVANGLMRRIQYNSSAGHVYAQAVEHMVACGIGWFRVVTDYVDDQSFDQEILIKRVFNPLSVYPDPSSYEPDRSTMGWCVVSELVPVSAFKKKYPKAKTEGMDPPSQGGSGTPLAWGTGDNIRVAEFWKRSETASEILRLKDGTGRLIGQKSDTVDVSTFTDKGIEWLKGNGLIINSRPSKTYKTVMQLVSGTEVLAEEYESPSKWIPLIPVIGAEIPLEQGTYRHGLIRFQREPQQLHNYFLSVAAESLGQQPKSPYLVTKKMIDKWKSVWDNANRKPTPYLPYEPDEKAPGGKPERIAPPPLPTGLIQMAQMLADDMKSTTGIYDAALGNRSNETSGVAIGQRIEQGNQATFHFADNLEHGLEHMGRVVLDMMPKVYDTKRTLRLMSEDDTEQEITVNNPVSAFDGQAQVENDMSRMSFKSVRVVMGPSFATRRQEAAQNMLQLAQAVPEVAALGADILVRHFDFDGAEQLADRLKSVLPPQVLAAEDPDIAAQMQQQQGPDPLMQMQQEGQAQAMQIELEGAQAKTEQEKARAAQEAAKVEGVQLDNALKVKKLREPPPNRSQPGKAGETSPAARRVF